MGVKLSPLNGPVQPGWEGGSGGAGPKSGQMIEVSRTLMKSEPELAALVAELDGLEVTMAEKGFGTKVEIRVGGDSGFDEGDLERVLDRLAEPQRQPFGGA